AKLDGVGTGRIEIQGVPALGGATHRVVADRIEAGTLIVAGAITGGDVTVTDLVPAHITAVLAKLDECGVDLEVGDSFVRVRGSWPRTCARPRRWCWPGWQRAAGRRSRASTISTAATSGSSASWRRWARAWSARREGQPHAGAAQGPAARSGHRAPARAGHR